MKPLAGSTLTIFFLFGTAIFPFTVLSKDSTIDLVDQLSALEENQIDIGRVCFLFAKEAYPDLDVDEYSKKLDQMVYEIRRYTRDTGDPNDPDHRIRCLNSYLYRYKKFHFDNDDPYASKLKNRYINGLIDTKSGSCFTMPLLYLALAQRLGTRDLGNCL
jgi:regulator of sirC expression with transglutaminase-like and TPR domain